MVLAEGLALVAEALAHLLKHVHRVDELDLAFTRRELLVGDNPDIGGDAGVVEKLVRQGDDGLQPVILDDPASDFTLARACTPGEQWGAIEDHRKARGFAVLMELGDHMLEEEEGAVRDTRQACTKTTLEAKAVSLSPDFLLDLLPFHTKGRV